MCHLQGQRITDIACQTYIEPRLLQNIENQRSSGRLAVRTRDTNHLGVRVTCRKLYLRNDRRALRLQFLNERRCQRDTR